MRSDEDAAPTTLVLGVEIDVALVYHLCTNSSRALVAMKPERDYGKRTVQLLCGVLKSDGFLERVPYVKYVRVEFFWVIDIIVFAILQV